MNTDRISIINQDQSESLATASSETVGYTVVAAEKGSATPVFVPAGKFATIYESIGYTSAAYPNLQEVLDFNTTHALYISAPYDTAAANKVPVAYVTPAGIFQRAAPVTITGSRIEDIELLGASIEGISTITGAQDILVPIGSEHTLFGGDNTVNVTEPVTYSIVVDVKTLSFNIGFDASPTLGELATPTATNLHFLNTSAFDPLEPARVMRNASAAVAILVVDIPGASAPIALYISLGTGNQLLVKDDLGNSLGVVNATADAITSITLNASHTRGAIVGLYAQYFSAEAIASTWASDSFRSNVKVYWKASLSATKINASIYQKYLSARTTTLTFPRQTLGNVLTFTTTEKITPTSYGTRTITGSLAEDDLDGFGQAIGFKTRLASQPFINIVTLEAFSGTSVFTATGTSVGATGTMPAIRLSRGERIVTDACLEQGWEEAQDDIYDTVEVFFNPVPLTVATTLFTSLQTQHELSRFVGSKTITPEAVTETLASLNYGKNYYIATNLFGRRSTYTKEDFTSPLVGAYASMIAKCIDSNYGGIAPMFLNQGGVGGQLNVTARKVIYKYTKSQLTYLDNANYNPIIRDAAHGIMVTSQKTASGIILSDWSYIGHSSAFLKFQREVREQVMIPQIGKPNNPAYQELRAQQVATLLRPRTEGLRRIWALGTVDTTEVNTDDVKAQRKFLISVVVRVDIFSEGVELVFQNLGQVTAV